MMREYPVIFSAPMVRAILAGSKTQTRRLTTSMWANVAMHVEAGEPVRLWVRETWGRLPSGYLLYRDASGAPCDSANFGLAIEGVRWISPRYMPRWASRITLDVVAMRKERLQEISHEDAVAEGVGIFPQSMSAQKRFRELWDSLHRGHGIWADNPEVYVIEFQNSAGAGALASMKGSWSSVDLRGVAGPDASHPNDGGS